MIGAQQPLGVDLSSSSSPFACSGWNARERFPRTMGGRPTTRPRSALREEVPLLMANDLRGDSAPDMHRHRRLIWMLLSPICTPWAPRTSTWYSRPGNRGCSASGADTALRDTAVPPVPTGAVPMPELSATAAGNEGGLNGFARPASARLNGVLQALESPGLRDADQIDTDD